VREVHITGNVPSAPDDAFAKVSDLERFPELCPDVREVKVSEVDGGRQSAWKVKFRGGMLEWTEQDEPDPTTRTLTFRQLHGDFKEFFGQWRVEPRDAGSTVVFSASFDLGIPALRAVLEPIAAKSLNTNMTAVLRGLFGAGVEIEGR
jgi:ribosome-associated toxin RatA of RatAB toxin-antitoxin module